MARTQHPKRQARILNLVGLACVSGVLLPHKASAAGTMAIESAKAVSPFVANVEVAYSGGTVAGAQSVVSPKPGSLTRPSIVGFSPNFLAGKSDVSSVVRLTSTHVTVPVGGLYAGSNNTVTVTLAFADGTRASATTSVTTPSYADPCPQLDPQNRTIRTMQQHRQATSDLNFDYFLVKDYCSPNAPALFDTDGILRWVSDSQGWVGTETPGSQPAIFFQNGIYTSDGHTGLIRHELFGGYEKRDYGKAAPSLAYTGPHNFDPGKNGIVLDLNIDAAYEAAAAEVDGYGNLLNYWDMGQIISDAMTAVGDGAKVDQFVFRDGDPNHDWFHMNATAYNPADNTLIVSSRENFVVAVDYDIPADGVRKIHWILGDLGKKWAEFASLRHFALQVAPGTVAPVGQHAVSIDSKGNLLLFDDGLGSTFQKSAILSKPQPYGPSRSESAARSYHIDTGTMTATGVFTYSPQPPLFSAICGSVYEAAPGTYLLDFTAAGSTLPNVDDPTTFKPGPTVVLQGLGAGNKVVFDLRYPGADICGGGWNAVPIPAQPIVFY